MKPSRLEVEIYQLAADETFRSNRDDGTGWDWCWADPRRAWMDETPHRFAYKCLPLTIANQTGWWIRNPVGFSATWSGRARPKEIRFDFDAGGDFWGGWISNQFGAGIVTWNTPFLFRTKPQGSRLLILGPANHFKADAQPLTAILESDWMTMSFTMNWKITAKGRPVRFEAGEPILQAIPLHGNLCADLEDARVSYCRLEEAPEVQRVYRAWHLERDQFHAMKARGEVAPDGWQKDYFQGKDAGGAAPAPQHKTKVVAPKVAYSASTSPRVQDFARSMPPLPSTEAGSTGGGSTADEDQGGMSRPGVVRESSEDVEGVSSRESGPMIDDEWRRWIAENLLLGATPENVANALAQSGFGPGQADAEVEKALASPYLQGGERLRNRLKKRDWILQSHRKLRRMRADSAVIERRERPSRAEFLERYYSLNRPVIITGMMADWPAMERWSLDYFAGRFGGREVEVQFGREGGDDYETRREKYSRVMPFSEYLRLIRDAGTTNDFYMTANNSSKNRQALAELWEDVGRLGEYLDGDPMGGFFWLGPAGTVTPFHHDLTNNLMAQVVGRKRIRLAPSWDIPLMENDIHVFSAVDGRVTAAEPSPPLARPQVLECVIGPGDILFLPLGCMHYVEGLDVSATMTFTNFAFDNDFHSFYSTYQEV